MDLKCFWRVVTKSEGSGRGVAGEVVKNSPGRRRVVPYTISAAVEERSALRAVLMPRRMIGRESIQASGLG